MSEAWHAARVVESRHWTEALFSLRVEGVPLSFQAGQFVRIALDIDGQRVARPFSFVNPPHDTKHEFYGIVVPEGLLSPRLGRLAPGDTLYLARNPAGFLVLSEVPDAQTLWLISTGTGIAPFLSILRTDAPWKRFKAVVLVHAVRHAKELAYRELAGELVAAKGGQFRYVTLVSREAHAGSLAGRIPAAIADGRLEERAQARLDPSAHAMLCGNPDMLKDVQAVLAARGMRKHRRRVPGHVTVESFW